MFLISFNEDDLAASRSRAKFGCESGYSPFLNFSFMLSSIGSKSCLMEMGLSPLLVGLSSGSDSELELVGELEVFVSIGFFLLFLPFGGRDVLMLGVLFSSDASEMVDGGGLLLEIGVVFCRGGKFTSVMIFELYECSSVMC